MVHSQDDFACQRVVGKLQDDHSKAVVAKAISEATEAVEATAEVRKGSGGTVSSRMSSPIEQFEKSTETKSQYTAQEDEPSTT